MTVRDLYEKAAEYGYLDAEMLISADCEGAPVGEALFVSDMEVNGEIVFTHNVILMERKEK